MERYRKTTSGVSGNTHLYHRTKSSLDTVPLLTERGNDAIVDLSATISQCDGLYEDDGGAEKIHDSGRRNKIETGFCFAKKIKMKISLILIGRYCGVCL